MKLSVERRNFAAQLLSRALIVYRSSFQRIFFQEKWHKIKIPHYCTNNYFDVQKGPCQGVLGRKCSRVQAGPPGFPVQKLENFPALYQNFLKYSKIRQKQTFRSVSSSNCAGFSRTALCRTSNSNFFFIIEQMINKQKLSFYSFITEMLGMHKR